MAFGAIGGKISTQEFVWDFSAGDLGTQAAQALSGPNGATLPDGAVMLGLKGVCEVPLVGANATITLGTTASAACFLASTAITTLDTVGKVIAQAVVPTTAVQAGSAANTSDVKMTIGTANLTAGKVRFIFQYYVPSTHVNVA